MTVQELIDHLKEKDPKATVLLRGWGDVSHVDVSLDHVGDGIFPRYDHVERVVVLSTKGNTL